jgi:hypothetical protein
MTFNDATTPDQLLEYVDGYTSREYIRFNCLVCGKNFRLTKKNIHEKLNEFKRGRKKTLAITCSLSCSMKRFNHSMGKTSVETECKNCGKTVKRNSNQFNKHKNSFCSSSCSATYNNTHKQYGTRRSKIEAYLEEQLNNEYPNLKIYYNSKTAINSELDIYIPELKLAFEINGVFHYKPIFGEEKLKNVKKQDRIKRKSCREKGITLKSYNVSSISYFTPERGSVYLKKIAQEINNKITGNPAKTS